MINFNLHTHTCYCGHGIGKPKDYADVAFENGFKLLGISDHVPYPDDRFEEGLRYRDMHLLEEDVKALKAVYNNGEEEKILQGWECEYFPDLVSYYQELREKSDYLIYGSHYFPKDGSYCSIFFNELDRRDLFRYADLTIKGILSGYFDYLAHPDVFFYSYEKFDSEARSVSSAIIDAAVEMEIPMEINGNGLIRNQRYGRQPYPMQEFWNLAMEKEALVIAGSDAHKPENLIAPIARIEDFFSRYKGRRLLSAEEFRGILKKKSIRS